jgi:two-component system, sensor histidine kinase
MFSIKIMPRKDNLYPNINLLIVDDNEDHIYLLKTFLQDSGLNFFTTPYPENALQICIDNDISITLIDDHMPEKNGFELLDLLKNNPLTEHVLIILMTGYAANSESVAKGLNKGATDYLLKPLELNATLAKVNSLVTLAKAKVFPLTSGGDYS